MYLIIKKVISKTVQPRKLVLETLEIDKSSYYVYSKALRDEELAKNAFLKSKIKRIFHEHKSRYGARRIKEQLKRENVTIARNTVAKYMKIMDIESLQSKSFRPKTTLSKHNLGYFPNLLAKNSPHLPPKKINKIWVAELATSKQLCKAFVIWQ